MKRTANPNITPAVDERLASAITQANYRVTLNNQKQNLRLKLEQDLTYAEAGGIFKITPQLISFVTTLKNEFMLSEAVLADMNDNPVFIENIETFLENIVERYMQCMNEMLVEFNKIKKIRTTKAAVEE
jgi:DNA-binding LytR/AlgR family response regulator